MSGSRARYGAAAVFVLAASLIVARSADERALAGPLHDSGERHGAGTSPHGAAASAQDTGASPQDGGASLLDGDGGLPIVVPGGVDFVRSVLGLRRTAGARTADDRDFMARLAELLEDPSMRPRAERLVDLLDELEELRDRLAEIEGRFGSGPASLGAGGAELRKGEALLELLGLRLEPVGDGLDLVATGGRREGRRRDLVSHLGVPLNRVRRQWAAGEPIVIRVRDDEVPLAPGADLWEQQVFRKPLPGGALFQAIVEDSRARGLMLALSRLDPAGAEALLRDAGLGPLYAEDDLVDALPFLSSYLRFDGSGRLLVPGGDPDAWRGALGDWTDDADLLRRLATTANGRAGHLWRALALAPTDVAAWILTLDAPGTPAAADWARDLRDAIATPDLPGWTRWARDPAELFAALRMRADGAGLEWPGGARVWTAALADSRMIRETAGLERALAAVEATASHGAQVDAALLRAFLRGSDPNRPEESAIGTFLAVTAALRYQPVERAERVVPVLARAYPRFGTAYGLLAAPTALDAATIEALVYHLIAVDEIDHDRARLESIRQLQGTLVLLRRLMTNRVLPAAEADGILRALFDLRFPASNDSGSGSTNDDPAVSRGYGVRITAWYRDTLLPAVARGLRAQGFATVESADEREILFAGLVGRLDPDPLEVDGIPYVFSTAAPLGDRMSQHLIDQHVPVLDRLLEIDGLAARVAAGDVASGDDVAAVAERLAELLARSRDNLPETVMRGELDEALPVPVGREQLFARGDGLVARLRGGQVTREDAEGLRRAVASWLGDALTGLVYALHLGSTNDPFGQHRHVVWPHQVEPPDIPREARAFYGAWRPTVEAFDANEGAILRNSLLGVPDALGRWNLQSAALARGGARLDETVERVWGAALANVHPGSQRDVAQSTVVRLHGKGRQWLRDAASARDPEHPIELVDGGTVRLDVALRQLLPRDRYRDAVAAIRDGLADAAERAPGPGNTYLLGRWTEASLLARAPELTWLLDQAVGMPVGRTGDYLGLGHPPALPLGEAGHPVADPLLYSRLIDVRVALVLALDEGGLPAALHSRLLPEAMGAVLGAVRDPSPSPWRDLLEATVATISDNAVGDWVVDLAFEDELEPADPLLALDDVRGARGRRGRTSGLQLPQPTEGFDETPTFTSAVELAVVDAGVWDAADRFVTDLEATDFVLELDGAEISPTFVRLEGSAAPTAFQDPLPAGLEDTLEPASRNFVLVADLLTTAPEDWGRLVDDAIAFVSEGLAPDDLVALVEINASRQFRVAQGFTEQRDVVVRALEGLRGNAFDSSEDVLQSGLRELGRTLCDNNGCPLGDCEVAQCRPMQGGGPFSQCVTGCADWEEFKTRQARTLARTLAMEESRRTQSLITTLIQLADGLAEADPASRPKTWVLLSGGFEVRAGGTFTDTITQYMASSTGFDFRDNIGSAGVDQVFDLDGLTESLHACRCTVYTIDTLGASIDASDIESSANMSFVARSGRRSLQDPLNAVARDTGGKPFLGGTDFGRAFEQILADTRMRYVLGVPLDALGAADGQPRWRRVRVRVQRPDVSVRSREGFYWPRPTPPE